MSRAQDLYGSATRPLSPHHVWSNLDFEYALRHGPQWRPPAPLRERMARWAHLLRALPDHQDALPWDGVSPLPDGATLTCWGESAQALQALGEPPEQIAAALERARIANDKRTSHRLTAARHPLPLASLLASREALDQAIAACPTDFLLKHPLGVSGRERVASHQGALEARHRAWADRLLDHGEELVFEPRVQLEREWSCHFQISAAGEVTPLGQAHLLTDSQGTLRGHLVRPGAPIEPEADLALQRSILEALHEESGYSGPVSTDAFCGTLDGEEIVRPVSEINARVSFGRVALELAKYLPPDSTYIWWHPTHKEADAPRVAALRPADEADAPGWYRLPQRIDPQGESATALYLAPQDVEEEALLTQARSGRLWLALRGGDR